MIQKNIINFTMFVIIFIIKLIEAHRKYFHFPSNCTSFIIKQILKIIYLILSL